MASCCAAHFSRNRLISYMINFESMFGRSLIIPISYCALIILLSHEFICEGSNINLVTDIYGISLTVVSTIIYLLRIYGTEGVFRTSIVLYCFYYIPFFWLFLFRMMETRLMIYTDDPACRVMELLTNSSLILTGYYSVMNVGIVGVLMGLGPTRAGALLSGKI